MNAGPKLSLNDDFLEGVPRYDYLGVTLDNTLMFKNHIDKLLSGCSQRFFTVSKIRRYIPDNVAILIYKSLIMSKIGYGVILCVGASKLNLLKLQRL